MLFEGIEFQPYLTELNQKIANTVDDNDYKDEYAAFQSIKEAINNVNLNKYPETFATMALLDEYVGIKQDMNRMIFDGTFVMKDQNGNDVTVRDEYEFNITPEILAECQSVYQNINRDSENYIFTNAIDNAYEEDLHIDEYNAKALTNNSESETIYVDKTTDYDAVAQGFYNQILSYRNTYGQFASEFTNEEDVKEFICFVNQFKDANIKSNINSLETFESMLQSYYNSCAIFGVDPNLSALFEGYSYAQDKLAQSEKLAANLKNGKGNDYSIPNEYYKWFGINTYMAGEINMSMKENAPLIIALRNQFNAYRLVGNMLAARQNQKTYDLGLGADGQLVCPDSIDDYVINQTFSEGGHLSNEGNTYDTFGTAYDYIKEECKGLSR